MNILVVEDDQSVCQMLELFLSKEGYQPVFVHHGDEAQKMLEQQSWDFVILDWMLPGTDGITLCKKLRQTSDIPLIMLTAKDTEADQILGLELGADDYITKPFSPLALLARIKAVCRRKNASQPGIPEPGDRRIQVYDQTREVFIDGVKINGLTAKEFDILSFLSKHPKQVFTREQLLEKLWGFDFYGDERTVDVHIKRLRKKISTSDHQWIHTVWGVGYKWDEEESS
ncbi:response regulator transcription factor [Microaerobacter geothermalis]|uniref:response regulator transcription factor n=1 Tax=Microaerobacter geothermalis TaxID=674972 RepID=UPI001F1591D1|nr:response regulator transcription factor [Microaerobacter geothermalis]MCF6093708.1 response regulator transcription factor [Microaerobacter geothermalis]